LYPHVSILVLAKWGSEARRSKGQKTPEEDELWVERSLEVDGFLKRLKGFLDFFSGFVDSLGAFGVAAVKVFSG
jgi:hypothetical protein